MKKNGNSVNLKNGNFPELALQFIRFAAVGVSNTLISMGIYYIFVFIDPKLYQLGNLIGWIVSVFNAFYWGNRVVFKNENNTFSALLRRLLKSYVSYGSTFLLGALLLYIEVAHLGVSEWLAPVINLLITIPLNFLLNKLWTFRK